MSFSDSKGEAVSEFNPKRQLSPINVPPPKTPPHNDNPTHVETKGMRDNTGAVTGSSSLPSNAANSSVFQGIEQFFFDGFGSRTNEVMMIVFVGLAFYAFWKLA